MQNNLPAIINNALRYLLRFTKLLLNILVIYRFSFKIKISVKKNCNSRYMMQKYNILVTFKLKINDIREILKIIWYSYYLSTS